MGMGLLSFMIFTALTILALGKSEHVFYTDIIEANTTESLERIKNAPIRIYEFKYDKVEGRKKMGILGQDAHTYFPESVDVVPSYVLTNKNRSQPSIALENFPIVDKNVIFMHGVAALQELLHRFDTIQSKLLELESTYIQQLHQMKYIESQIMNETDYQSIAKTQLLHIEAQYLKVLNMTDHDIQHHKQLQVDMKLQEDRKIITYEEDLAKQRLLFQEELSYNKSQDLLKIEKEKIHQREELSRQHQEQIQNKRALLEQELEQYKATMEIQKIKAEIDAKASQDRANEDMNLRKIQLEAKLNTQKSIEMIKVISIQMMTMMTAFVSNPMKLLYGMSIILGLLAVYYIFVQLIDMIRNAIQASIGKPSLVRETSYQYINLSLFLSPFKWIFGSNKKIDVTKTLQHIETYFQHVILNKQDLDKIYELAISTRNTKLTGTPYRHVLLHGPPGTGKTLIARQLAQCSGMDYAIMSGGDVCSLSASAVDQLHKLFKWASKSSRGLLLFIDEAEAFLASRNSNTSSSSPQFTSSSTSSQHQQTDSHMRSALNALLYQTGVQSTHFMMILATNRPQDLDSAILDRIDISVYIGLPATHERQCMIQLYKQIHIQSYIQQPYNKWYSFLYYFSKQKMKRQIEQIDNVFNMEMIEYLIHMTEGFSGREISKLFIAIYHAYLLNTFTISSTGRKTQVNKDCISYGAMTIELIKKVVEQKVIDHHYMKQFQSYETTPMSTTTSTATNTTDTATTTATNSSTTSVASHEENQDTYDNLSHSNGTTADNTSINAKTNRITKDISNGTNGSVNVTTRGGKNGKMK